jgi:hypothetical protein
MKCDSMKALLQILPTTVLLVLFIVPVQGQGRKEIMHKGIKSITVYEENVDEKLKEHLESVTIYDKNGKIIEEKEFNSEGKLKWHVVNVYDENGQKIKETEYDAKGNVLEMNEYTYQNSLRVLRVKYNGKGEIIEKKRYVYTMHD